MSQNKVELVKRCLNRLAEIKRNNDDGIYAKHYNQDVSQLIMWVNEISAALDKVRNELDELADRI